MSNAILNNIFTNLIAIAFNAEGKSLPVAKLVAA
jgi:uncharacterized membrane protein YjjB (DUF3815 family)